MRRRFGMRVRLLSGGLAAALVAAVLALVVPAGPAGAVPPGSGNPYEGIPVEDLTDAQIADALEAYAPGIASLAATGDLLEGVPASEVGRVNDLAAKIQTHAGRLQLAQEIRAVETDPANRAAMAADDIPVDDITVPTPGLLDGSQPTGDSEPEVSVLPASVGTPLRFATGGTTPPVDPRDPRGGTEGGTEGPPAHPLCPAVGIDADPDVTPGTILSPRHDTFMGGAPDYAQFTGFREVVAGSNGERFLKVKVLLADPKKGYPVGALDVRVWLKTSIGEHAGTVYGARAAVAGAPAGSGVFCFPDSQTTGARGYAVVMVPLAAVSDPGFQLYTEVVEWDPWFQWNGNLPDIGLMPAGPQYWAAGSQVMVHVGPAPLTTRAPFLPAVAAWADRGLLVDDDGNPGNDLEATIKNLGKTAIDNFLSGYQSDDLIGQWAFDTFTPKKFKWDWNGEGQASFTWDSANPPNFGGWVGLVFGGLAAQIVDLLASFKITGVSLPNKYLDLSWVNLGQGDSDSALRAYTEINNAKITGKLRLLGLFWCRGSLKVKARAAFDGWIEEGAPTTELRTHAAGSFHELKTSDLWMPWYNWLRPNCVAGWLLAKLISKGIAQKSLTNAILGLLVTEDGNTAAVEKAVNGLNIPGRLGALSVAGSPVAFTGFRDSCAPGTCAADESFLQGLGVDVMGDGTLGPVGGTFTGTWPAVYTPIPTTTVDAIVRPHANAAGQVRDIGLVANAGLVEVLLHDVAAAGLLSLPVAGTTITPTIAPMYLVEPASPTRPFQFVAPDIHGSPLVGGTPFPIAVSLKASAGATIDTVSGVVDPVVDVQPSIEFLDCLTDYVNAYALSYGFCGHANQGAFGLPTLSQFVNDLASQVAGQLVDQTLGQFTIPTATSLVPGVAMSINQVEVENRGGHITLLAERDFAPGQGGTLNWFIPQPYFTFTVQPAGYPGSGGYSTTWQVVDTVTGQQFSTAECTNQLTCFKASWMFQLGTFPNSTTKYKQAKATVTVSRQGVMNTSEYTITHIP